MKAIRLTKHAVEQCGERGTAEAELCYGRRINQANAPDAVCSQGRCTLSREQGRSTG
ncbi:MAG: hypothetical protein ACREYF_27600 [Gammaproteobacteria bacterium]